MLTIQDPKFDDATSQKAPRQLAEHPFFQLAFRSSFVLGSAVSFLALFVWLGGLNQWWLLPTGGLTPTVWHLHEMLFGFGATIAVGFVLTAVQTWTGIASLKGNPLILLLGIWLVARALFLMNIADGLWLAIGLQVLWWLAVIGAFTHIVLRANNRRNYLFIPLFVVMMLLNIGIVVFDLTGRADIALHLGRTMVLMFGILMAIVGGRVIPFFTKAGARLDSVNHPAILDKLILATSVLGTAVFVIGEFYALPITPAVLMISAGLLHLTRLSFWRSTATVSIPLLWSLHLSYFSLALGLIALGISYFTVAITFSSALHLITIGAMGLMIFAMMSRVSLGHTGRALQPKAIISLVFVCLLIAAFARAVLPLFAWTQLGWQISAICWLVATGIFLWVYTPILLAPRADGRL